MYYASVIEAEKRLLNFANFANFANGEIPAPLAILAKSPISPILAK
jgi:hypothetical protein